MANCCADLVPNKMHNDGGTVIMPYSRIAEMCAKESGVELSTMMKTPCIRYMGDFVAMMFEREDSLIVKLSADRVQ